MDNRVLRSPEGFARTRLRRAVWLINFHYVFIPISTVCRRSMPRSWARSRKGICPRKAWHRCVEVAPGNEVFRLVDIAVKSTEAKPGAQLVEREFGMFEVHSRTQAEVLEAGRIILERLGLNIAERIKPFIASVQIITNVDPYQAQLLNRFRRARCSSPVRRCWCSNVPRRYINMLPMKQKKAPTSRSCIFRRSVASGACGSPARKQRSSRRAMRR